MKKIVIATRGSKLALWQAEHIKELLQTQYSLKYQLDIELLVLKTKGDLILDVPLAKIGGKGLFVKEIEEALLDGRADFAVHSMKDVPMELPAGLCLGVIAKRASPFDLLLSQKYASLAELPTGASIGTSSLRRQAQILALRPDLQIKALRGNIDTRLQKLLNAEYDAIIMAEAGLQRLQLNAKYTVALPAEHFLPACGQGALGLEYLKENIPLAQFLSFMHDQESAACITAERSFLKTLDGGCQTPIGALAEYGVANNSGGLLKLEGLVADLQGKKIIRKVAFATPEKALELGKSLAQRVLDLGGKEILAELYGTP